MNLLEWLEVNNPKSKITTWLEFHEAMQNGREDEARAAWDAGQIVNAYED